MDREASKRGAPPGVGRPAGHEFDEAILSRLSPYLTEHVNRFGKYTLNLDRTSPAPDHKLSPRPMLPMPQPVLASVSL
jgi:hypothetical protein